MFRNSSQIAYASGVNRLHLLPSPDSTSDESEADIIEILDTKRRQFDEEIAKFRSTKDKEFQTFEQDLRATRRKRRKDDLAHRSREEKPVAKPKKISSGAVGSSSNTNALSLLAGSNTNNVLANGADSESKYGLGSKTKSSRKAQSARPAPLSKPTLSVERLTISGETTPPLHGIGTPPSTIKLAKSLSRSPTNMSGLVVTPPRQANSNSKESRSTLPAEKSDLFVGIFAPAYLPLLESKVGVSSVPTSPRMQASDLQPQRRVNSFSGIPQQSIEPSLLLAAPAGPLRMQRALTAPSLRPINNPPSALRTSNGSGASRKGKRVTFQLADSAIVEPSSSYEEGMSPDLDDGRVAYIEDTTIDEVLSNDGNVSERHGKSINDEDNNIDMRNSSQKNESDGPVDTAETKRDRSRSQRLRSPVIKEQEHERTNSSSSLASDSPDLGTPQISSMSPPDLKITESGIDGSGVGFFELDEELSSPGSTASVKPFISEVVETNADVEFGADLEQYGWEDGNDFEDDDEPLEMHMAKLKYEYSGSVPINIIKPSGSWVGSFGH